MSVSSAQRLMVQARLSSWLTTTTHAGSFQLCKLGVEMTLLRLTSATFAQPTVAQVINAARATISLSHGLVEFLEQLLPAEFDTFWAPCACNSPVSS